MVKEQFVNKVMGKLSTKIDAGDVSTIRAHIEGLFLDGFSLEDAVAHTKCLEEVNPRLSETVALARMDKIKKKYAKSPIKSRFSVEFKRTRVDAVSFTVEAEDTDEAIDLAQEKLDVVREQEWEYQDTDIEVDGCYLEE
jgi:tRNA threonylcarbamoyladenosine modification (KEOPS) complex  Pcc1 subunit